MNSLNSITLRVVSGISKSLLYSPLTNTGRRLSACRNSPLLHSTVAKTSVNEDSDTTLIRQSFRNDKRTLKDFIVRRNPKEDLTAVIEDNVPYLNEDDLDGNGQKVFVEVYGCQMNTNDTEIVYSILKSSGYEISKSLESSDAVLLMTCSIREGAEQKIWQRVEQLKGIRRQRLRGLKIGILGCMAERLKTKIMEKESHIDLICGPDSYRSLPRLLSLTSQGHSAANVLLSLDETYADIQPVRRDPGSPSAFVSIMRGCDNMCTYCVVPFTRGRERSRAMESIVDEVRRLIDQGVKDVTLLGQNVNSYRDNSAPTTFNSLASDYREGFKTVYRRKAVQSGYYNFVDLLERVSSIQSELRIRFTSPHPKDFLTEVLQLIRDRPNICKHLHVPAQSGSNSILEAMGRGYTAETYLDLIQEIKSILPGVSLSSDFIAGFCGETEEDHQATLNLMEKVKYNVAYCFPYSMREKTRAHHRLEDNLPKEVKMERADQLVEVFRKNADLINKSLVGSQQLVLVEGTSKRSQDDLYGRGEAITKVIFPNSLTEGSDDPIRVGDYVVVEVTSSSSQVLKGVAKYKTTLKEFHEQS